jgi:hypothetical protein
MTGKIIAWIADVSASALSYIMFVQKLLIGLSGTRYQINYIKPYPVHRLQWCSHVFQHSVYENEEIWISRFSFWNRNKFVEESQGYRVAVKPLKLCSLWGVVGWEHCVCRCIVVKKPSTIQSSVISCAASHRCCKMVR